MYIHLHTTISVRSSTIQERVCFTSCLFGSSAATVAMLHAHGIFVVGGHGDQCCEVNGQTPFDTVKYVHKWMQGDGTRYHVTC